MTRADEGEGREPGQIAYEAHPTNDTLELLGAFGRSCKIGKHQATNWEHLRTTIHALDAAGQREEADTLLWQVWHRVNSAARHHEFYRISLDEKYAAEASAAQAEAEVARLTQERDEALCLAEGPSTLLDLARGSVSRGMELHAAEAEVARLTAALAKAEASDAESLNLYRNCRDRLEASASALRERVATLEAALRPFAIIAECREPIDKDRTDNIACYSGLASPLAGHLRAARTALEARHEDK